MADYNIITGSTYLELIDNVNTFISGSGGYYPIGTPQQTANNFLQALYSGSRNGNGGGGA